MAVSKRRNLLAIHGYDAEFVDYHGQVVLRIKQDTFDGQTVEIDMSIQEARVLANFIDSELGPKYA